MGLHEWPSEWYHFQEVALVASGSDCSIEEVALVADGLGWHIQEVASGPMV